MAEREDPCTWLEKYVAIRAAMMDLPVRVVLEGLVAWAARIECGEVALSLDCRTCPRLPECPRFGGGADSGREWWAVGGSGDG